MICEHGQKLNKFCIVQHCKHPTSGGCNYCFKKNHFHLGRPQFITLQQVEDLIITLNGNNTKKVKPKQNILKQLLSHYFDDLKKNIVSSLQRAHRSMQDMITYPYLFQIGLQKTFKKLNSPELKKMSPQQLHKLYQFNLSNTTLVRQKKQKQYYVKGAIQLERTLQSVKNVFQAYTSQIMRFDEEQFVHGEGLYKKITNVIKAIKQKTADNEQQQTLTKKQSKEEEKSDQNKNSNVLLSIPKKGNRDRKVSIDVSGYHGHLFHKNNPEKFKNIEQKRQKQCKQNEQAQEMTEVQKQRYNKRKLLLSQMKHLNSQIQKIQSKSHHDMYERRSQDIESQQYEKQQNSQIDTDQNNQLNPMYKYNQNNSIYQIKVSATDNNNNNDKDGTPKDNKNNIKNLSIPSTRDKIRKLSQNLMSSPFEALGQEQDQNPVIKKQVWKQCNSQIISQQSQQIDNALLPHPPSRQQFVKSYSYDSQQTKPKTFKFKINGLTPSSLSNSQINEIPSPIIRKKAQKKQRQNAEFKIELIKANSPILQLNKIKTLDQLSSGISQQISQQYIKEEEEEQSEGSTKEVQNFSENQIKSLALFTESLKLNPQEAIYLLRSSLIYCPENLSSAEYLSYLLLEQNQPKQCLLVCNNVIEKILGNCNNQQDYFSVHIINNKAAALNQLGRFSETIACLERCHQFQQKQSEHELLFKNLADAYFSLGIYQKAVSNYQKSIKVNQKSDQAIYNLAVCYFIQGNYNQCLKYSKKAFELNPFNKEYKQLFENCRNKLVGNK